MLSSAIVQILSFLLTNVFVVNVRFYALGIQRNSVFTMIFITYIFLIKTFCHFVYEIFLRHLPLIIKLDNIEEFEIV